MFFQGDNFIAIVNYKETFTFKTYCDLAKFVERFILRRPDFGEWAEVAGGEKNGKMFDIAIMLMNRFSPLSIRQIVSVKTMFLFVFCLL